jgi:hypothetical protein
MAVLPSLTLMPSPLIRTKLPSTWATLVVKLIDSERMARFSYSTSGVIGWPSLATADKGRLLLESFSAQFKHHLALLRF